MLRELQVHLNKAINSMYKADGALKTGMGVVADHANKTVGLPDAETAEGIVLVNKERIPTGANTGYANISDWDTNFVDIATGEFVKQIPMENGERYGVDQYADGLLINDRLSIGTDGKWKKAGAGINSRFVYAGTQDDAGHTLAIVEVTADVKANA
jgi:hypothetical protein